VHSNHEPRWWSWADIVGHADQLGIPNFQRGAVWDTNNRTALLESLFEQSPCGSFVLWEPEDGGDPLRHGVPLRAFEPGISPLWLVDGQQRTRAMLDTYQQLLTEPSVADGWTLVRKVDLCSLRNLGGAMLPPSLGQDEEGNDIGDSFWGVVFPAMREFGPYFGSHSESRHVLRGSMFRQFSPRARIRLDSQGRERSTPPLPVGLVPLAALIAPEGVFLDDELRSAIVSGLRTFQADGSSLRQLDELVPWGPQFVTGHAYERPALGDGPPTPMRWADLHARRDASISETVGLLAGLFAPKWRPVLRQFRSMFERNRFAVGWLPSGDVSAAIDAYVRINRSGIRVRSEERALALLSRAHPGLLSDLAYFVSLRDEAGLVADHRSLLTHESERQLGFASWMAAVTRYSTLALLGTVGCRWLGTSAIDKETFGYRLDRVGPNETEAGKKTWARPDYATPADLIEECSRRATQAVAFVDSILSVELRLDHRMARPPSRGLAPLIDLFYRLPESAFDQLRGDNAFRCAAARLLHWTLLAPYIDQASLDRLILDGHGIDQDSIDEGVPLPPWDSDEAEWKLRLRGAFRRYQSTLIEVWDRRYGISARLQGRPVSIEGLSDSEALNTLAMDTFALDVSEARSLQHPAVGWLYAIERRGKATEFLWQAQYDGFLDNALVGIPAPSGELRREEPLRAAVRGDGQDYYPEKQHLVPFAFARQIVNKGGTRATASPANSIGNLTWLSRRQNGLEALSDRWTVMDREHDVDNIAARGMFAPASDEDRHAAIDLYEKLRQAVVDGSWRQEQEKAQGLFDSFCEARAEWIIGQMRDWLQQPLPNEANEWLTS